MGLSRIEAKGFSGLEPRNQKGFSPVPSDCPNVDSTGTAPLFHANPNLPETTMPSKDIFDAV
jgi:hypothetical protein